MNKEMKDLLLKVILFGMGVFIFFWIYQDPERDNSGNIISEGSLEAGDLLAGDCYLEDFENFIEEGEYIQIGSVKAVPCAKPHNNEVFKVFESLPYANRSSISTFDDMADMCLDSVYSYLQVKNWLDSDFDNLNNKVLSVVIFNQLESNLADPDRKFSCVFQNRNNILTTSSVGNIFIK
jgi:hypothetical protein